MEAEEFAKQAGSALGRIVDRTPQDDAVDADEQAVLSFIDAFVTLARAFEDIASGDWHRYPNSEYHKCGTLEDFAEWAVSDAIKDAAAVREP